MKSTVKYCFVKKENTLIIGDGEAGELMQIVLYMFMFNCIPVN